MTLPVFSQVTGQLSNRGAVISIILVALGWSLLSGLLAFNGHQPSGPTLFAEQYQVQAWILPIVLLTSWQLYAGLIWQKLICQSKQISRAIWFAAAGRLLSIGYGLCWVLPDLIAFALGGFSMLGTIAPLLPIATTCVVCFLTTRFVNKHSSFSSGKVFCWVLTAWLVQAIPVLLLIR